MFTCLHRGPYRQTAVSYHSSTRQPAVSNQRSTSASDAALRTEQPITTPTRPTTAVTTATRTHLDKPLLTRMMTGIYTATRTNPPPTFHRPHGTLLKPTCMRMRMRMRSCSSSTRGRAAHHRTTLVMRHWSACAAFRLPSRWPFHESINKPGQRVASGGGAVGGTSLPTHEAPYDVHDFWMVTLVG